MGRSINLANLNAAYRKWHFTKSFPFIVRAVHLPDGVLLDVEARYYCNTDLYIDGRVFLGARCIIEVSGWLFLNGEFCSLINHHEKIN